MWFDTILWLVAIVAFIAVEAATTALVSVWFAVGAAAAMVVSLFTVSFGWQLLVFAVVSAVTLALMVPGLLRRRGHAQPPVTNGSPLTIGKQGVVLVDIEPGMPGRVRVDGLDWEDVGRTAKSDKKMEAGVIKFILLKAIGHACVDKSVTSSEMKAGFDMIGGYRE